MSNIDMAVDFDISDDTTKVIRYSHNLPGANEVVHDLLLQTAHRYAHNVSIGVDDYRTLGSQAYNVRLDSNNGLLIFQYNNKADRDAFHDVFELVGKHVGELVGVSK